MKEKLLIPSVYRESVIQVYMHSGVARIFQWGDDFCNLSTKITHFYAYFGKVWRHICHKWRVLIPPPPRGYATAYTLTGYRAGVLLSYCRTGMQRAVLPTRWHFKAWRPGFDPCRVRPKDLKSWYSQFPCLTFCIKG